MPPAERPDPQRRHHAGRVVRALARLYPEVRCALEFRDAYELIVATILSAQCTDARVNQVTPALFARYPDAAALAGADVAELEGRIHSTGFFRSKAKHLIGMATALVGRHGGAVPRDLNALTALPGVGRKTAHVVLGTAFGIASGVVVDTHVKRLAYRLGLTESTDPAVIERELALLVPRSEWILLSHRLITHGRATCTAPRPRCGSCALERMCPRRGVSNKRSGAAEQTTGEERPVYP
ncbi:MAG TPA: endonuclease III [Isosphaeraceae bacterium]|jgi:endonuclease-3